MYKPKYEIGQTVYMAQSGLYVREAKIIKYSKSTGLYTIKFTDTSGGMNIKEDRLFATNEEVCKAYGIEPKQQ